MEHIQLHSSETSQLHTIHDAVETLSEIALMYVRHLQRDNNNLNTDIDLYKNRSARHEATIEEREAEIRSLKNQLGQTKAKGEK